MRTARHDVQVDLNRHTPPGQLHQLKQISQAELRRNGLYAFTAINAPRGLKERIFHVWLHEGREVDRIALHINGGREAGYRAWTRKQRFPADAVGRWQVKVVTDTGQMIGTLRFRVEGDQEPAAAP